MKSISMLALVSAMLVAGPALAADLVADDVAAAPISSDYDWSGFYAGVHAGYGSGNIHLDITDPLDDDEAVDGFIGGVQVGYNVQSGNIVFGLDSSLSLSSIHYEETAPGVDDTIDWIGSTTGRIGLALDGILPYVKAGIAYGGGTGDAAGISVSENHVGWTAGAGAEFAVADNISVFGEYAYTDLGATDYVFGNPVNTTIPVSMQLHTVRAGLNFGF